MRMTRHEATFEIDEKSDSHAVRRILEQVYDTIREESRTVRQGTDDGTEVLQDFESLRDAAEHPTPGKLTITYYQYDNEFDE